MCAVLIFQLFQNENPLGKYRKNKEGKLRFFPLKPKSQTEKPDAFGGFGRIGIKHLERAEEAFNSVAERKPGVIGPVKDFPVFVEIVSDIGNVIAEHQMVFGKQSIVQLGKRFDIAVPRLGQKIIAHKSLDIVDVMIAIAPKKEIECAHLRVSQSKPGFRFDKKSQFRQNPQRIAYFSFNDGKGFKVKRSIRSIGIKMHIASEIKSFSREIDIVIAVIF